jgi:1-acyl-sn-glycerol-3-phosphate acyltransferase
VSALHFFPGATLLVLLGRIVEPRRFDPLLRLFCRNVVRLAGGRLEVRAAPGFDRERTSFFVANHVNLFDPFVLYAAVPQFLRGLELESHFRIPVYGWMMRRFGNVPVPDGMDRAGLRRLRVRCRHALEEGVSLAVFPEGTRTLTGAVGPFRTGVFRMAIRFGVPIVPVTIEGAFGWKRKGSWMLRPGRLTVHLHATVETAGLSLTEAPRLREEVRAIVARPLSASSSPPGAPPTRAERAGSPPARTAS